MQEDQACGESRSIGIDISSIRRDLYHIPSIK